MSMIGGKFEVKCFDCDAKWNPRTQKHYCGLRKLFEETMSDQGKGYKEYELQALTEPQLLEKMKQLFHEYERRIEKPKKKHWWSIATYPISEHQGYYETSADVMQKLREMSLSKYQTTITYHNPPIEQ